jgi:hypothetical protein
VDEWRAWLENPERTALEGQLSSRLAHPAEIGAFAPAADYSIQAQSKGKG